MEGSRVWSRDQAQPLFPSSPPCTSQTCVPLPGDWFASQVMGYVVMIGSKGDRVCVIQLQGASGQGTGALHAWSLLSHLLSQTGTPSSLYHFTSAFPWLSQPPSLRLSIAVYAGDFRTMWASWEDHKRRNRSVYGGIFQLQSR